MIEILYHTLWETVHVFFDHHEMGHEVGDAGFLYPFLGKDKQQTVDVVTEVAASIQMKVRDDAQLRERVAHEESEKIGNAAIAMHGSGLRIGEALALRVKPLLNDCSTISVVQSLWHGDLQSPKTESAIRKIDLSSALARMIREFRTTLALVSPVYVCFQSSEVARPFLVLPSDIRSRTPQWTTASGHLIFRWRTASGC